MPAGVNPVAISRGDSRGWTATCAMICADCAASASVRLTIWPWSTLASTTPSTTIGARLNSATWRVRLIRPSGLSRSPRNRMPLSTVADLENWSGRRRYGRKTSFTDGLRDRDRYLGTLAQGGAQHELLGRVSVPAARPQTVDR